MTPGPTLNSQVIDGGAKSMLLSLVKRMGNATHSLVYTKLDEFVPAGRFSWGAALAVAAASVALAAIARGALGTLIDQAQFVTFFPAVIVSALVAGVRGGLLAVALAAGVWWLWFASSLPDRGVGQAIAVGLFVLLSSIVVLIIGAMRVALSETRDRTSEIRRSMDLLRRVIDGMPDAIFLYEGREEELRFSYINSSGEAFLGRPRAEVIGKADKEIVDAAHASENCQVIASNQPLRVNERLLETAEGTRCVEIRKFPIKHVAAGGTGLLTIIRDVTDLRELEDSLRQRHRIDALGQLTGGIAHDFNNLLAIAIGNLDLAAEQEVTSADTKELLEDARNACLRGAELTSRLLAFARKQTLEPVTTNFNELLSDYTKLLTRLLGADIDLRLRLANNLWEAIVDRAQLEAAITNLATNARDAMPRGGRLIISTRNEVLEANYTANHPGLDPGKYVAVEVSDNGHGMTAEVQEKAVEPFFTTKAEGHGTGLGLSMVFGFAKQSGGHVRIYSEPGQGTTVTLLLPRAEGAGAGEATERLGPPRATREETLLVVDDNTSLRRVTVRQLTSLGYRVLEADDGPSALQVLREEGGIDLLLTDIIMPGGLSGVDLGREARQVRPDLKLIYMSGFPEAAFGDRADLEPGVVLLRKPFRKVELATRIREALGGDDGR
ncbi:MAG TPA: ATP-binding protein [Sphingomicrobium sp.]|nr:ATP-binding protein [Sphingomicrobium sp.]